MIVAAFYGHINTAKVLIKAGAKVDAPNAAGQTALMLAASVGATQMCSFLLNKQGADVLAKCSAGQNALWYAQMSKHEPTVQVVANAVAIPMD